MLRATLQESIPLQVLAADGRTDLFARVTIYQDVFVLGTLDLPHIDQGLYGSSYTPTQEGYLTARYALYEDVGFTVPASYDLEAELIEVSSDKTNILRILGLMHENSVLDQTVYDNHGNLLSGRIRAYDTKANAQAAGLTGLRFTWAVTATYTGPGMLTRYGIERQS
jgi:hypothetical protein